MEVNDRDTNRWPNWNWEIWTPLVKGATRSELERRIRTWQVVQRLDPTKVKGSPTRLFFFFFFFFLCLFFFSSIRMFCFWVNFTAVVLLSLSPSVSLFFPFLSFLSFFLSYQKWIQNLAAGGHVCRGSAFSHHPDDAVLHGKVVGNRIQFQQFSQCNFIQRCRRVD